MQFTVKDKIKNMQEHELALFLKQIEEETLEGERWGDITDIKRFLNYPQGALMIWLLMR